MSFALETWQQGGDLIPFEEAPQREQQVIVFMHLPVNVDPLHCEGRDAELDALL